MEHYALTALFVFVIVILALAAIEVMQRRLQWDPVTAIARPFFPGPTTPTTTAGA